MPVAGRWRRQIRAKFHSGAFLENVRLENQEKERRYNYVHFVETVYEHGMWVKLAHNRVQ
jgi:uncharacterized Zn finger protein